MTHEKATYWTAEERALLEDPKRIRGLGRIFACPICDTPLERTPEAWACPAGLGHTRLVSDGEMLRRIAEAMQAPDAIRTSRSADPRRPGFASAQHLGRRPSTRERERERRLTGCGAGP